MKRPRRSYYTLQVVSGLSLLIMVLMAAAGCRWYLYGGRLLSVQTNSMLPVYRAGDALLVNTRSTGPVAVGDIISYHSAANPKVLISHRVIALNAKARTITTKGDNLSQPDLPVPQTAVYARVHLVAPWLGRVLGWLRTPLGLLVALYIPTAVTVMYQVYYWSQPRVAHYRYR